MGLPLVAQKRNIAAYKFLIEKHFMLHFLTIGIVLGLSAGFAPGPLLTLVISESLQHGVKAGIKVALAPAITDVPIVILTLFVISKLSAFNHILGGISLMGGLVVLYMGYESIRAKGVPIDTSKKQSKSLLKGTLANALSPHPYIFWLSVGAPIITKAMKQGVGASLSFVAAFYIFLLGSKIVLAIIVNKYKFFLRGKMYMYTLRFLGVVLWGLAALLFYDGLKLLAVL